MSGSRWWLPLLVLALVGCGGGAQLEEAGFPAVPGAPAGTGPAAGATPDDFIARQAAGVSGGTNWYVEQYPDRVEVWGKAPDKEPARLTQVPAPSPRAQVWVHIGRLSSQNHTPHLTLLVTPPDLGPGGKLYRIDLPSGTVTDLGDMLGPPFRFELAPSPDGRYLAWNRADLGHSVDVIDLLTGERLHPSSSAHVIGKRWSPDGEWLAVRAAGPSSGLPVYVGSAYTDGASLVELIHVSGQVRRLEPPEPLQLTSGPVWSPGGGLLAVTAGVVAGVGPGQPSEIRSTSLWMIHLETGRWSRVADWTADDHRLTEWGKWPGSP